MIEIIQKPGNPATLTMNPRSLDGWTFNHPGDGEYPGLQSGYKVVFRINSLEYTIDTKQGVRGMNVPCTVKIDDGKIVVV